MHKVTVKRKIYFSGWWFFLFCFILYGACTEKKRNKISQNSNFQQQDTNRRKPPGSFEDTLVITYPSAVFYNSDSLQLQKIKGLSDENQFESNMHDCFFQMRNARMVIKQYWPKIHIIETSTHRFLQFVKMNKTSTIIDLNTEGDICGIFLFDGKKEPELTDMMNIDTFLGFYFEK